MASGTMVLDDVSAGWQTTTRPRPHAAEQSSQILADSRSMRAVMELIERAALHDTPVLLVGESGTGKELLAHAIHNRGPRAAGPFVAVNCSAIPETLLESELFGYKKGAFTDARDDQRGLFQSADARDDLSRRDRRYGAGASRQAPESSAGEGSEPSRRKRAGADRRSHHHRDPS